MLSSTSFGFVWICLDYVAAGVGYGWVKQVMFILPVLVKLRVPYGVLGLCYLRFYTPSDRQ